MGANSERSISAGKQSPYPTSGSSSTEPGVRQPHYRMDDPLAVGGANCPGDWRRPPAEDKRLLLAKPYRGSKISDTITDFDGME